MKKHWYVLFPLGILFCRLVQGISIEARYCLPKCLGLDYFRLSFLSFRIFAYTSLVVHSESKHLTCKMASSPWAGVFGASNFHAKNALFLSILYAYYILNVMLWGGIYISVLLIGMCHVAIRVIFLL